MTRTTRFAAAALVLHVLAGSTTAADGEEAQAILKRVDETLGAPINLRAAVAITTQEPGTGRRTVFAERLLRPDGQVIRYTGPDDLKSTELQIASTKPPSLFIPAADSVRSVSDLSELMPGTFLPVGYFTMGRYSDLYRAHLIKAAADKISLRLEAMPGSGALFPRIDMVVDARRNLPMTLRYYQGRTPIFIESRKDYLPAGEGFVAKDIVIRASRKGSAKIFVSKVLPDREAGEGTWHRPRRLDSRHPTFRYRRSVRVHDAPPFGLPPPHISPIFRWFATETHGGCVALVRSRNPRSSNPLEETDQEHSSPWSGDSMARPQLVNGGDPLTEGFPKGPEIGEPVPDFTLPDQFGNQINYSQHRGDGQAIIVFYRSASW